MKRLRRYILICSTILALTCLAPSLQFSHSRNPAISTSTVMAGKIVTKAITAENQWTAWIKPSYLRGYLNISISGTSWTAIVTLQRSFDGGSTQHDVPPNWTANTEKSLVERENAVSYRLGVKTGDYTSGTPNVRLSK